MSSLLIANYGSDSSASEDEMPKKSAPSVAEPPAKKRKKIVIDDLPAADSKESEDEDERPYERPKSKGEKSSLTSLLPPPKHSIGKNVTILKPLTIRKDKIETKERPEPIADTWDFEYATSSMRPSETSVMPTFNPTIDIAAGEDIAIAPYPETTHSTYPAETAEFASAEFDEQTLRLLSGRRDGPIQVQSIQQSSQVQITDVERAQRLEEKARKQTEPKNGYYMFSDHQHRKHNIQWLAHMAKSREAELNRKFLDMKANKRMAKDKYGF